MARGSKLLLGLVAVAAAGGIAYRSLGPERMAGLVGIRPPAAAPARAAPAVPVTADRAREGDVPIVLAAIGTVQAYNTVTVRARVDGLLERVAFTEGQDVRAGDVLAQIDARPFQAALDGAEAARAKDEAQLANARRDLQRVTDLKEYASKQNVDTQRTLVAGLEATLLGDRAAVENARVQLGYTTITAPINGRTGARLVDAGNMVRASEGTGLLVITQVQPITVGFTLPQEALDALGQAQARGLVPVEAYLRDDATRLGSGALTLIDNQIDPATGTIRLKATFANENRRLWPGQFVNVRVQTGVRVGAVTVPARAVQRGAAGTYAYVVRPDATVEQRAVRLGQVRDGAALIESGLKPGETVVTDGQYKLRPGTRVETGAPAQAREERPAPLPAARNG